MDNRLINYLQKITNLTSDESQILSKSMVVSHKKKGSYLIKEGQYENDSFFIMEGLVRQFKIVDGNEVTTNFFTEEQWIINFESIEGKSISKYNLLCEEDTIVVVGDEDKAVNLFKQFPKFERVSRQIMETVFKKQQEQMVSHLTDKPEKRYLNLLAARPDIFQRVAQYHVASYIGVKPESLSRIRKKLAQQR